MRVGLEGGDGEAAGGGRGIENGLGVWEVGGVVGTGFREQEVSARGGVHGAGGIARRLVAAFVGSVGFSPMIVPSGLTVNAVEAGVEGTAAAGVAWRVVVVVLRGGLERRGGGAAGRRRDIEEGVGMWEVGGVVGRCFWTLPILWNRSSNSLSINGDVSNASSLLNLGTSNLVCSPAEDVRSCASHPLNLVPFAIADLIHVPRCCSETSSPATLGAPAMTNVW